MLYLTSWSKHHALMRKGIPEARSGRAFTIMAKPRKVFGEIGDGFCGALVPRGEEVELMQELVRLRRLDVDDPELFQRYRHLMIDRIKREGGIAPGVLRAGDDLAAREHVRLRWTRPLRLVYTCSGETARQFPLGSQVLLIDAGRGLTDQRAHLIGRESEDGDTWTLNFALMR